MFQKTNQVSPIRTQSPIIVNKHSNPNNSTSVQQHQAQSYYTSSKTTPMKMQEQKFEIIQQGATIQTQSQVSPEKNKIVNHDFELQVLRNEIIFREQKIDSLEKALDLANEDRIRLRSVLEQKSILCVNKEREIAKLLATIHYSTFNILNYNWNLRGMKIKQSKNFKLKSILQNSLFKRMHQIDKALNQKIQLISKINQILHKINLLNPQDKMNHSNNMQELSQKYQEKFMECQQLQMLQNQTSNYHSELKESEQNDIHKNTINHNYNSYQKQQNQFDQQNEIQKFLSQIKQQYLEESPKRDIDDQEQINVYRPIYSFQSTEDINKTEKINK